MTLALSLIEILTLAIIGPFVNFLLNNQIDINLQFEQLLSLNSKFKFLSNDLIFISFILIILFFLKMIFAILINWKLISFVLNQQVYLRLKLVKHFSNLNYQIFINKTSGEYIRSASILTEQYSNCLICNNKNYN